MDIGEVRAMVIQLKKVGFASCEEYIVDLIDNYEYSKNEIFQLKMELIQLYIGSRKYAKSFEIYQNLLADNEMTEDLSDEEVKNNTRVRVTIFRKLVHLGNVASQPIKDEILEYLNESLPFDDDAETEQLIIDVI